MNAFWERLLRRSTASSNGMVQQTRQTTEAELAAFLEEYAPIYRAREHPLLSLVPAVSLSRSVWRENPDPDVFQLSAQKDAWVNANPDESSYVYSSAARGYRRKAESRPHETYRAAIEPKLAAISQRFDPALEPRIRELEAKLLALTATHGLSCIPSFALRGISCVSLVDAPERAGSLAHWERSGYLSEHGANFFVFHGADAPIALDPRLSSVPPARTGQELLPRIMASSAAAFRYAERAPHPVVLLIDLDRHFDIPASGGNDGIDGSYPHTIDIDGQRHHLQNLDVGALTRCASPGRTTGRLADGVPEASIRARIGADGLPSWASRDQTGTKRPADERIALSRWFYKEVLEGLSARPLANEN